MNNWKERKEALSIAAIAHQGQFRVVRRDEGKPYFYTHVMNIYHAVSDRAKPAAALHDVIEDCPAGADLVAESFDELRISSNTFDAVQLLTKQDREKYDDYIDGICMARGEAGKIAREVKLADLMDNYSSDPYGSLRHRYLVAICRIAPCVLDDMAHSKTVKPPTCSYDDK